MARKRETITYEVTASRGIVEEMTRYEGATFEVLEVVRTRPRIGRGADTIRARITSNWPISVRWQSFGVTVVRQ